MKLWPHLGIALVALAVSPARAEPTADQLAAVQAAEARGAEMYAYDQAAWHASDALEADLARKGITFARLQDEMGFAGYVVEPAPDGSLVTTFYGRQGGALQAIARYVSAGGKVKGGLIKDADSKALSALAQRMIAARDAAVTAFGKSEYGLCTASPANTLVLPPDAAGRISAYILTSTITEGVYPAGGHYRFDFAADGKPIGDRRFMKACFPLDTRKSEGRTPALLFLTHLLDPQPTEIHVFVSYNIPVGLYVGTSASNAVWEVNKGKIRYVSDLATK